MNIPKVSIVAIVYNVEPYLRKCLDSIINQTLKELEIIIVYDKSTDNSLEIIREFEQKDSRIKVIVKDKKEGPAKARNYGLSLATGEYAGFVDTDDYIELEMFEKLYNKAKKYSAEVAIALANTVQSDSCRPIPTPIFNSSALPAEFDDKTFNINDIEEYLFKIPVTFWNKLYKREFLLKNNISFEEGLVYDDQPFFFNVFANADKMVLVREKLYNYRLFRSGSTMENRGRMFFDIFKIMEKNEEILKKSELFEKFETDFYKFKAHCIIHHYFDIKKEFKKEFFNKMLQEFRKMNIDKLENKEGKFIRTFEEPKTVVSSRCYYIYSLRLALSKVFDIKKYGRKLEIIFLNNKITLLLTSRDINKKVLTKEELEIFIKQNWFKTHINRLIKKYKGKRVFIYGGGLLFSMLKKNFDLSGLNITGIADKRISVEGELIEGYKAFPISKLKDVSDYDAVIISTLATGEIKNMLLGGIYRDYKKIPIIDSFIKDRLLNAFK